MARLEEFKFKIPAYTPETMPFGRLKEYLENLVEILGDPNEIHLVGIEKSSTVPVLKIPAHIAKKSREHIATVRRGGADLKRRQAFARVQAMLAEDGSEPATLTASEGDILLTFEPIERPKGTIHVRQPTTLQGELVRVGGTQNKITLLLRQPDGSTLSGIYASKGIAKAVAAHIFEQVRVAGIGT